MAGSYDYGKRADEIADATRRFLVGLNTGGVAVTLTFAGSLLERGVPPSWTVLPVSLFVLGLGISGFSLLYAKHKALKRRNAIRDRKPVPKFDALFQRNHTYEVITLLVFLGACAAGLCRVQAVNLQPAVANQAVEKQVEQQSPNKPSEPTR